MKVKHVTNSIKELRFKNNDMSQQVLADLVGCSRQTIHVLEKNKYSPSFVLVKKISKALNVTVDEVIQVELE
ncbi:MAG: helix-turn-helix transcriptional regulator [Candidatus Izemoplasmatales bacterium]|jgi:putative transcriptional regulator